MRKVSGVRIPAEVLPQTERAVDLLQEFHDAQRAFPPASWRAFELLFVGNLSNYCPEKVWRDALLVAGKCMKGLEGQ